MKFTPEMKILLQSPRPFLWELKQEAPGEGNLSKEVGRTLIEEGN